MEATSTKPSSDETGLPTRSTLDGQNRAAGGGVGGEGQRTPDLASARTPFVRRLAIGALLMSWGWFSLHFLCTAIYLLPLSTLTAHLYPAASAYMHPYFRQTWSLFAPDPDGKTTHFQFQCRVAQDDGSLTESSAYDMSNQYYSNTWKTRLGPGHRVHRVHRMPVSMLGNRQNKIHQARMYLAEGQPDVVEKLTKWQEAQRQARVEQSRTIAGRLATVACRKQFPLDQVVAARALVDIVDPRPFRPATPESIETKSLQIDFGWSDATATSVSL